MKLFEKKPNEKVSFNIKYKDSFFTKLYSQPEAVCDLYNKELHPGEHIKEEDIEIITLDNILVNSYYNDLGFVVKDKLIILVEHQSTVNGNMPLRMLIYLVEEYKRYIREHNLSLYRSTQVELPKPELYLIYTGEEEFSETKLTFGKEDSLYVSLKYSLIREAKATNSTLEGYLSIVKVVERFKQDQKKKEIKKAIQEYLERKDKNSILAKFLVGHEMEVVEMLKERLEVEKILEARYEDGLEKGLEKGIVSLYLDGAIDKTVAANKLRVSIKEFEKLAENYKS